MNQMEYIKIGGIRYLYLIFILLITNSCLSSLFSNNSVKQILSFDCDSQHYIPVKYKYNDYIIKQQEFLLLYAVYDDNHDEMFNFGGEVIPDSAGNDGYIISGLDFTFPYEASQSTGRYQLDDNNVTVSIYQLPPVSEAQYSDDGIKIRESLVLKPLSYKILSGELEINNILQSHHVYDAKHRPRSWWEGTFNIKIDIQFNDEVSKIVELKNGIFSLGLTEKSSIISISESTRLNRYESNGIY